MAQSLANAYVQILPTAKGMKDALKNIFNDNMPSGSEPGEKYGNGLASKIKGVIAAAGIGKALSSAVMEGANLEQSLGGIETLFKESADKVKQNAANAYKTAGMSANEYMELTTSFSASLLSSLANDTSKSADVADMAMTDMSDNANKMGSSMEDIKNAYQGFAKQNYTMLDNLKLGYGGTKTEMQRLLADAQKITGVKYDINNLADVYNAIHVIQGELGITGTTAKEAASTLSGSFSAMKASFKNVLGQITLGMDIKPALNALANTVVTFLVGNLIPAVWNIVSALPSAVMTFAQAIGPQLVSAFTSILPQISQGFNEGIPQIVESAQNMISQFCANIQENLPTFVQNGVSIITSIVNGILQNLPSIVSSAGNMITEFTVTVLNSLPEMLSMGSQIILNLVNGIINNLPQIVSSALNMIARFISTVAQNLPRILQTGIEIIGKLAAGLIRSIPSLVSKIPQIIVSIKNAFMNTDWMSIGTNIIKGIANGLANAAGMLWSAVKGVLGNFKDKVLSFFGIHSPSTWGIFVGKMIDTGVAKGLIEEAKSVMDASDNVTNAITEPFRAAEKMSIKGNVIKAVKMDSQIYRSAKSYDEDRTTDLLDKIIKIFDSRGNGNAYFYIDGKLIAKAIAEPISDAIDENKKFENMLKGVWA